MHQEIHCLNRNLQIEFLIKGIIIADFCGILDYVLLISSIVYMQAETIAEECLYIQLT